MSQRFLICIQYYPKILCRSSTIVCVPLFTDWCARKDRVGSGTPESSGGRSPPWREGGAWYLEDWWVSQDPMSTFQELCPHGCWHHPRSDVPRGLGCSRVCKGKGIHKERYSSEHGISWSRGYSERNEAFLEIALPVLDFPFFSCAHISQSLNCFMFGFNMETLGNPPTSGGQTGSCLQLGACFKPSHVSTSSSISVWLRKHFKGWAGFIIRGNHVGRQELCRGVSWLCSGKHGQRSIWARRQAGRSVTDTVPWAGLMLTCPSYLYTRKGLALPWLAGPPRQFLFCSLACKCTQQKTNILTVEWERERKI